MPARRTSKLVKLEGVVEAGESGWAARTTLSTRKRTARKAASNPNVHMKTFQRPHSPLGIRERGFLAGVIVRFFSKAVVDV